MSLKREFLALAGVVAIFVTGGTILMQSGLLPEEHARDFRSLEFISLQSEMKVIQEPTPADNTYIYAINDVAGQSWEIAKNDERVKEILQSIKGSAITIAAVQPTAFATPEGKVTHSGQGQVVITANWQLVDGKRQVGTISGSLDGKSGESHQKIWNIHVDLEKQRVVNIASEQGRIIKETLAANIVYSGMNMYLPYAVESKSGSTVRWVNNSPVPHNVVGVYVTESEERKIDSGFFSNNESWSYTFNEEGVFDYHCTIHLEEGMKGSLTIKD